VGALSEMTNKKHISEFITFDLRHFATSITWYNRNDIYLTDKKIDGTFKEKRDIIRTEWTTMPLNNIIRFITDNKASVEFRIADIVAMTTKE
jgi:hypothetical protein